MREKRRASLEQLEQRLLLSATTGSIDGRWAGESYESGDPLDTTAEQFLTISGANSDILVKIDGGYFSNQTLRGTFDGSKLSATGVSDKSVTLTATYYSSDDSLTTTFLEHYTDHTEEVDGSVSNLAFLDLEPEISVPDPSDDAIPPGGAVPPIDISIPSGFENLTNANEFTDYYLELSGLGPEIGQNEFQPAGIQLGSVNETLNLVAGGPAFREVSGLTIPQNLSPGDGMRPWDTLVIYFDSWASGDPRPNGQFPVSNPVNYISISIGTPPKKLLFDQSPTVTFAGATLDPVVTVKEVDDDGRVYTTDDSSVVTLSLSPGGGTLDGTTAITVVDGVASFPDLSVEGFGSYQLVASTSSASEGVSSPFSIAGNLQFLGLPKSVIAASPNQFSIGVVDGNGNVITSATSAVALSVFGPGSDLPVEVLNANLIAGEATFSGVTFDRAGYYSLKATSDTGASAGSPVIMSLGILEFGPLPSESSAGTALSPAIAVSVVDANGNDLDLDTSDVALSLGTFPTGGVLAGTLNVATAGGVAIFSDLEINQGGKYTLRATGNFANGAVTSGVFTVTGTPLKTVADLAKDVYAGLGSQGADNYFRSGTSSTYFNYTDAAPGFFAAAYSNSDNSEVVIAIRGTDNFENAIADASFGGADPNSLMRQSVKAASDFVQAIVMRPEFQDAHITLTGHSLGGAIAQLVGKSSELDTYAFNAPGSLQLLPALSSELAPVEDLGSNGVNINYRVYGDQASFVGKPIDQVVTLSQPANVILHNQFSLIDPAFDVESNFSAYKKLHKMDTVISQLGTEPTAAELAVEPNDSLALEAALQGLSLRSLGAGATVANFLVDIPLGAALNNIWRLVDPSSGSDFVFSDAAGMANLGGIVLPSLDGVASYSVRYDAGGVWSNFQSIQPGVEDDMPPGVNGVEFAPIDATGNGTTVAGSFFFGVTFSTAGTFSGTLSATGVLDAITTLSSSAESVDAGDPVTFTATVKSFPAGSGSPTGMVSFLDANGDTLGTSDVGSDGTATFSTTLPIGLSVITAAYGGDDIYPSRNSSPLTETVTQSTVVPSFAKVQLPASAVAGNRVRIKIPIILTNIGTKLVGPYTVNLFFDSNATPSTPGILASTITRKFSIGAGAHEELSLSLNKLPAGLSPGTYNLMIEMTDPNKLTYRTTSTETINVALPFVSLAASVTPIHPASINAGASGSLTVTVTNNGNADVSGLLEIELSPSIDGMTPENGITLTRISKRTTIRAAKSTKYTLHFKLASSMKSGNYFPYFSISLGENVVEIVGQQFSVMQRKIKGNKEYNKGA